MHLVHRLTRPSIIEGWSFGIGVMRTESGGHIGACYRPGESSFFLHMAFHFNLKNDSFLNERYGWVACKGFSSDEAEDFASWIAEVWRRNGNKIPYAINYWPGAHYVDGKFNTSKNTGGLTCATFVISLFDGYGTPLIDASTWKAREDDRDFQQWIVGELDNPKLAQLDPNYKQHSEQQKKHIGKAVRFRPYEIAYAVSIWDYSLVTFEDAVAGGQKLEEELIELSL